MSPYSRSNSSCNTIKLFKSILKKLIKDGKVEDKGNNTFGAIVSEPEEGEGTGEISTLDNSDDFASEDDYEKYIDTSDIGRDLDYNSFEDSVDIKAVYSDFFKKTSVIEW